MITYFPAFLIGTPCLIINSTLPAGIYDADGNCVIKVPFELVRPDMVFQMKRRDRDDKE